MLCASISEHVAFLHFLTGMAVICDWLRRLRLSSAGCYDETQVPRKPTYMYVGFLGYSSVVLVPHKPKGTLATAWHSRGPATGIGHATVLCKQR